MIQTLTGVKGALSDASVQRGTVGRPYAAPPRLCVPTLAPPLCCVQNLCCAQTLSGFDTFVPWRCGPTLRQNLIVNFPKR
jgi:hypothetical protein